MNRARLLTVSFFLITALILAACQSQATATPLSAAMSELKGKVDLKQAGQDSFAPATAGSFLDENGQLQTGDDGRVRLDLSTGTIIRVAPSSLFTLLSNEPSNGSLKTTIQLELGRIFIVLNGGSADVQTPSGTASVRGSYMMVEVNPATGDVTLTCLEGNCSAGEFSLTTGQMLKFIKDPVTGQYHTEGVQPMSDEDYQTWLDENPEFKDIVNFAKEQSSTPEPTEAPTSEPTLPPSGDGSTGGTGGAGGCFALISPVSDVNLQQSGPMNFEWESQAGAEKYVVTFTYPDGTKVAFETTQTNMTRYIESMPGGGDYQWEVSAFGSDGSQICTAQPFTFTKPQTPTRQDKKIDKGPAPTEAPPPCEPFPYCQG